MSSWHKREKEDPILFLTDAEIRNGIETAKRVKELVESAKLGGDRFALNMKSVKEKDF